jgi:hypothetical protein
MPSRIVDGSRNLCVFPDYHGRVCVLSHRHGHETLSTDKRDAAHILRLLLEDRFPKLWMPSPEERDGRQLLIHRHKLVEIRTRIHFSIG